MRTRCRSCKRSQHMADIFVSYASEDRARVEPLVRVLESQGWSVWWDRKIRPGASFQKAINDAIRAARCVVVCWTERSVESEWVWDEAEEGRGRGILVPVLLDEVRPPLGFRAAQLANLHDWGGDTASEEIQRFLGAVSECLGGSSGASIAVGVVATTVDEPRRRLPLVVGAAVLAILAFGLAWWTDSLPGTRSAAPRSVAVLPLVDISPSRDQSWIGESIATEILAELSQLPDLRVASRATSFTYGDSNMDVRAIGRELAVENIIEGTVRRSGNQIRVTIELITVESGYQEWIEVFDRTLEDGFDAEIDIADRAVAGLSTTLAGPGAFAQGPTLRIEPVPVPEQQTGQPALQSLFDDAPATFQTFGADASAGAEEKAP